MNPRLLIGILGGGVAGFLAGWFLRDDSPDAQREGHSTRIVQLENELKSRSREIERLAKTAGKSDVAGGTQVKDAPAFDANNPDVVKMQERMKKQIQEKQKLKLDERMAGLRTRLGLNDAQASAIRELLEKNPTSAQSLMLMAMSGEKVDEAEMTLRMLRPGEKDAELTEKIAALLTPEQQQAYTDFRQEQRTNEVEVKANKELARLQSSLTLTPEQKDRAFEVVSKFASEEYDNPVSPMAELIAQQMKRMGEMPGMEKLEPRRAEIEAAAALAAERRQQRVEAMRAILTPEQVALYEDRQKQANMAEYMETAFDEMPGGMFGIGTDEVEALQVPPPAPVEEAK